MKSPTYKGNAARWVRCQSGQKGARMRLRSLFKRFGDQAAEQWHTLSRMHGLAKRLGFKSEFAAWEANPVIESSNDPRDFRVVFR